MNSLLSYGSDDDYEDSSEEKQTDWRQPATKNGAEKSREVGASRQSDVNYEEVQMDLSEDSDQSQPDTKGESSRRSRDRDSRSRRSDSRNRYDRDRDRKSSSRDSPRQRDDRRRRSNSRHDRDNRDSRSSRNEREDRYRDDKYRTDRDDKYKTDRDDKYRSDRRDKDRRSKRSSSREKDRDRRRNSRSPRRSDRESRHSRSRSRDRSARKYVKRYDRSSNKMTLPERPDIQKSQEEEKRNITPGDNPSDRFFMPGITGRFRDQIERRKLLWHKKEPEQTSEKNIPNIEPSRTMKVWETTTFAQDTDGKVASKFKRLMGIKGKTDGGSGGPTDVLKKQEEMFSSMEQQYEVARTATHTMRGVGLGFGSYQR